MLRKDIQYGFRLIRKTPLFTFAVVGTVALAIAANTAIFSVVNAVLVRPLPFVEPDRLIQIAEKNDKLHLPVFSASVLNFLSWREMNRSFAQMAAIGFTTFNLSDGHGEPEQLAGNRIGAALLPTLGVAPVAGRGFSEDEERPGGAAVAMIGEGVWTRRFGRDRSLIGRTISLNGAPTTVVGIAPAALRLIGGGDIYVPLTIDLAKEVRLYHLIFVVGRLKPGVSVRQAQSEFDSIVERMHQDYPEIRDWGVNLVTFFDTFVSPQLKTGLVVLLGAVMFVLLIACANIANLLLSRLASREKEIAIRSAMGATKARVLRQLLVESLVLAAIGGVLGIAGAYGAVRAINAVLPPNLLPVPEVGVDSMVLVFAAGLTLLTGLVFGIVPAITAARAGLSDMLKKTGRGTVGSGVRLRRGLAAAELALATLLLIGAGLLLRSFMNLRRVDVGFEPRGLLTFQLAPPTAKYGLNDGAPLFYRQLLDALQSAPGVKGAAISSGLPFGQGNYTQTPYEPVGQSVLAPGDGAPIDWRIVSPGFFKTMGMSLLRGRDFTDSDRAPAPLVTIVSQSTAKVFWGDGDPVGRMLKRRADGAILTVIGVVTDVRNTALNQESPCLYYPLATRVWQLMDVAVRSDLPPEALLPTLRRKVHELDAELPLATVRTMEQWLSNGAAPSRLSATVLGAFAAAAALIAAIGIYGVLAFSVNQRTQEIGVRMALGAQPGGIVRLIVREGMIVAGAGIGTGLLAAWLLGRAVESLVYEVPVHDAAIFGLVGAGLALVAFAACSIPARRASLVDPIQALRYE